jgi:motility quorum-sensing regulator/GCU-specific mRNA interferase toxin
MEKRTPQFQLPLVKMLIEQGKIRSTYSSLAGAAALGFDFAGMVSIIEALTAKDFYKSMTTHADHKVWQDVYRPTTPAGAVYLKPTVIDDVLIVSFKEL